ncbi:MAG: family 78 glycoside hydrolase catalytic domain [Deltaproteobacteria bacterium]|nr:family 78 glycoside hydrolase catalytic domain [Deltaproteobacteria bacterium]
MRDLRAETLNDPLGLDVKAPLITWTVWSRRRGAQPSAYEVQAAARAADLDSGSKLIWSTGRVQTHDPLHALYGGPALKSRQEVFWRVRVWDESGQPSDWSSPARFEMGLCEPGDWKATWIGAPDAWYERERSRQPADIDVPQLQSSPLLVRRFNLAKAVRRARVYVAGFGTHELYLNGRKVGDRVIDPTYTNADKRVLYVAHDVTKQLRPGANALGVILGNGRYQTIGEKPWKAHPKLLLQLEMELVDGSHTTVASDEAWEMLPSPWRIDGTKDVGETYDARLFVADWASPSTRANNGEPVSALSPPKGVLTAQVAPPIRAFESLTATAITNPSPGVYVFDFGQNLAGWARLQIRAPAGTHIEMRHAERLGADGKLDYTNIGPASPTDPPFQRDIYIASGRGEERWQPRFTYHGFRYVEVQGLPSRPSKNTLRAQVVHTDFETIGSFSTSDQTLLALQRLFKWSYRSNFVGIPTDCPHREKNGWTGDAHLAIDAGLYNYHNAAAYLSWLREVRDAQRADGRIPGIAPTGAFGFEDEISGPTWDLALYLVPWRLYEHGGDARILEAHWDTWMRQLAYLKSRAQSEHILDFGIADWLPAKTKTPAAFLSTASYFQIVDIARQAAHVLEKVEDEKRLALLAQAIRSTFRRRFVVEGNLQVRTQAALATALALPLLEAPERVEAKKLLLADIHAKDDHLDTGVNGAKTLIRVLADEGLASLALRVITQPTPPSFGAWLKMGATTLWEDWSGGGSRNHVYQGDISAFFYRTLAGLEPASPGWQHVRVRPNVVAGINWLAGSVRTVRGEVSSRWQNNRDGSVDLSVVIPPGAQATIEIEAPAPESITESGRSVTVATPHLRVVNHDNGRVKLQSSSGTYRFHIANPQQNTWHH